MQLSSIKNLSFNKINFNTRKNNYVKLAPLAYDSVSFQGKPQIKTNSDNVRKANNLGKRTLEQLQSGKTKQETLALLLEECPELSVKSIDELQKTEGTSYYAFFTHKISKDFAPINSVLYLNLSEEKGNEHSDYFYASDLAHEYTHALQALNGDIMTQIRDMSSNDKKMAELIGGFGGSIFSYFDNAAQTQAVLKNLSGYDKSQILRYGHVVPRKQDVDEKTFLKNLGYKNFGDYAKYVNNLFDKCFDLACAQVETSSAENVLPELKELYLTLKAQGRIEELRPVVKKYCIMQAQGEKEAYTTEAEFARRYCTTKSSINLDNFVMYYSLLEKALER